MPWGTRLLNDGRSLPEIGWGSWRVGFGSTVSDQVEQAIETGFSHIDTAQVYKNEQDVGNGIRECGLDREDLWVTTKWSGLDNKQPTQSVQESLDYLGLKSVDLYLIHAASLTHGDPAKYWREMEEIKKAGFARSIGVSNFKIKHLEMLREAELSVPVVNQILLHPYVYAETKELLEYHAKAGIVTEAYSTLIPITQKKGPVTPVIETIGKARGVTPAAVLFAWVRSKGAVVVTTSRSKERLEDYLSAGDLELTEAEIKSIDVAGAASSTWHIKKQLAVAASAATLWGAFKWLGKC